MIAIVCLDDRGGMSFNCRRQSRDASLRARILKMAAGVPLWMSPYSAKQFAQEEGNIRISDTFLEEAGSGEYAFVEIGRLAPYEEKLEKLVVFRWNRIYPADHYFDICLTNGRWYKQESQDFPGKSHDKITMEVYAQ